MKVCPECGRNYGDDAVVCAYDGFALSTGSTSSWSADKARPPEAGDVLGVYRILGQMAEGGMGVIYRAEHVRLGRQVALKVLKPDLARRTDVVQRFFGEARAVNEIGHPNIVDVIDFVEVSDQDPPLVFMVMELLTGEDLANRVRGVGPLDADETVEIACQVCDALIAVHRVKILHRDLKPENIFLVKNEDGPPRVKLLDFGVAKAFGERQQISLTDPGTAIGTPEYMAPEQILGKELDERTDIYALGLVLYDMLTNSVPFQASKYGELLVAQVKEAPEPVSSRRREGAPVPPALEQVVMRCLQKKPQERFSTVRELRDALLASVGKSEASAGGPSVTAPRDLAVPPASRSIPWVPIGIGAAALLAGFVAVWLLMSGGHRASTGADAGAVAAPVSPDLGGPDGAVARATSPDAGQPDQAVATAASAEDRHRGRSKRPGRHSRSRRHKAAKIGGKSEDAPTRKRRRGGIEATLDPFAK